jgi:hypothetical protein
MALSGGGPEATDDELLANFADLQAVARRLSSHLALASLSIQAKFVGAVYAHQNRGWVADNELFCDEFLYDAGPWQIIGKGHLRRLGASLPGARRLEGGRVEVPIGEPRGWLLAGEPSYRPKPGAFGIMEYIPAPLRNPAVQDLAQAVLGKCVLQSGQDLFHERLERKNKQA